MDVFCAYDELIKIDEIKPNPKNPNQHPESQIELLARIIEGNGWRAPVTVSTRSGFVVRGHGRLMAARRAGFTECPVDFQDYDSDEAETADLLADNRIAELSFNDDDALKALLSELDGRDDWLDLSGYDASFLEELEPPQEVERSSLVERFGAPPFSVLDTRQGYWQERRREWLDLGIRSEVGRDEGLTFSNASFKSDKGYRGGLDKLPTTSIFDPVLCELMYSWFAPVGGRVLDPFAGGSVRGIVADRLGLDYLGIELRPEQVAANMENATELSAGCRWVCDDSQNVDAHVDDETVDFLFSCPPYVDLEVYSDDPADLSTMAFEQFRGVYGSIIERAARKLKPGRFACFVVSEVRGSDGMQYGFVAETVRAFERAGLMLYNDMVLLNSVASGAVRATKTFQASRKVIRLHQNVLVFVNGEVADIKAAFPIYEPPKDTDMMG